jgi:gamma-glutamyltranspeptidase/glutathione hydrolase
VVDNLRRKGHDIGWRRTQGRAMGIIVDPQSGIRMGAADPRSPDRGAAGY